VAKWEQANALAQGVMLQRMGLLDAQRPRGVQGALCLRINELPRVRSLVFIKVTGSFRPDTARSEQVGHNEVILALDSGGVHVLPEREFTDTTRAVWTSPSVPHLNHLLRGVLRGSDALTLEEKRAVVALMLEKADLAGFEVQDCVRNESTLISRVHEGRRWTARFEWAEGQGLASVSSVRMFNCGQ
jgi:hypothetical protein